MEPKSRYYAPLSMSMEDAGLELKNSPVGIWHGVDAIKNVILAAKATPLQAQAMLIRAWARVQVEGLIVSPRDLEPSQSQEPQEQP